MACFTALCVTATAFVCWFLLNRGLSERDRRALRKAGQKAQQKLSAAMPVSFDDAAKPAAHHTRHE